jgi:hypothetical protein
MLESGYIKVKFFICFELYCVKLTDIYTWYLLGINGYLKPGIFRYFFYKRTNLLLNSI